MAKLETTVKSIHGREYTLPGRVPTDAMRDAYKRELQQTLLNTQEDLADVESATVFTHRGSRVVMLFEELS